jgi:hypothetical protein
MAKVVDTATSGVASLPPANDRVWVANAAGTRAAIAFELSESASVTIETFDETGNTVRTLLHGRYGAGSYRITDDADAPRGVRFVRMTVERTGSRQSFVTKYAR